MVPDDRQDAPDSPSRRSALTVLAGGLVVLAGSLALPGAARGQILRHEKIALTLPEFCDDGARVPVTVAVDSPMTEADHVRFIHLIAESNPTLVVGSFNFYPWSGRAFVSTHIRLAKSQVVRAVAVTSTGHNHIAARECRVGLGCRSLTAGMKHA